MDKKYYYLSYYEYKLLDLFDLNNFVRGVPSDTQIGWYEHVIPYDFIDDLACAVYAKKVKNQKRYAELLSFVRRLQEILEFNEIC